MAAEHISEISSPTSCQGNMNQTCKVCGEPAAGFHFGAFTCEGCKSFFGRTYNNISSLNDCKNDNRCVINKKTRTSCKSCRLRKCLLVGMSKSGSRYGRRSNWFKIHYLMQSNNNNNNDNDNNDNNSSNHIINLGNSESPLGRLESWESLSDSSLITSEDKYSLLALRNRHSSSNNNVTSEIAQGLDIRQDNRVIQPTMKLNSQFKINGETINAPEAKRITSPSSSSSDSHTSDSSIKENGEVSIFPSFMADPVYAKDLLSLCSQNLGQRLSPYLNPNPLASRFLYPYYPNIFSLYSRNPYIDTILNRTKNTNEKDAISKNENKESLNKEFQPPLKMFKASPSSPTASQAGSPWNPNLATSFSSQTPSPKAWCQVESPNDNKQITKTEIKNEDLATSQNAPIDLSVRSKESPEDVNDERKPIVDKTDHSPLTDKYKISFVIEEDIQKKEISSIEQQIPLDLSGFKT